MQDLRGSALVDRPVGGIARQDGGKPRQRQIHLQQLPIDGVFGNESCVRQLISGGMQRRLIIQ